MKLKSGMSVHLQLSWLSPVKVRNITIVGSKKMVTYNDIEPTEKVRIYDKGVSIKKSTITPFTPAYRSGTIQIPALGQREALYLEIEHVIDCIRNDKKPLTGGKEGLDVVKLIKFAEKSLKTGKKVLLDEKT
jgi:predicted dehydrogenase